VTAEQWKRRRVLLHDFLSMSSLLRAIISVVGCIGMITVDIDVAVCN